MMTRRILNGFGSVALAAALGIAAPAAAQESAAAYPSRAVKMIVPFGPGGAPDVIARTAALRLNETLGQQFVIDNRPSAGGVIAAEMVAKSAPDGYTLLMGDPGTMIVTPAIRAKLPYDPVKDFTLVRMVGTGVFYLGVPASLGVSNFGELAALIKSKPGQLNYGSSGIGSIHHLAMEMLNAQAGLKMVHVPYKGAGQSVPALVAGELAVLLAGLPAIAPHAKAGSVKILAVAAPKRAAQAPDVPTLGELGLPGLEVPSDIGIFVPAGTPAAVVSKLAGELGKAVHHPDTVRKFMALGLEPFLDEPVGETSAARAAWFKSEIEKYAKVARAAGLKID